MANFRFEATVPRDAHSVWQPGDVATEEELGQEVGRLLQWGAIVAVEEEFESRPRRRRPDRADA